ncbi:uncharacterized protein LOC132704910 [Cylas formicarius]|uniref:uncharacterized protein LOC132704910 n=1 Tax=Cylas formicarius TaxID=197179 RepID=UPI0029583B47|nr:uncharacterized protein LOC132704910 [Cylas formicarius]XP_060531226.1 uncharacterized protein LOC132704910 [Cylas formicarius]
MPRLWTMSFWLLVGWLLAALQTKVDAETCGTKGISCVSETSYKSCYTVSYKVVTTGDEITCQNGYRCDEDEGDTACIVDLSKTTTKSSIITSEETQPPVTSTSSAPVDQTSAGVTGSPNSAASSPIVRPSGSTYDASIPTVRATGSTHAASSPTVRATGSGSCPSYPPAQVCSQCINVMWDFYSNGAVVTSTNAKETTPSTTISTAGTTTGTTPGTTTATTPVTPPASCSTANVRYPSARCNQYYRCRLISGTYYVVEETCSAGQAFNANTLQCEDSDACSYL